MKIDIKKLSSGYYHIRGRGPCNWTQVPHWPCDEQTIREHCFPQVSEEFIAACVKASIKTEKAQNEQIRLQHC